MRHVRSVWLLIPLLAVACVSIPGVSPTPSGIAPTLGPTTTPAELLPSASVAPLLPSASIEPQETPPETLPPEATPKPRKTPKPTRQATPTPTPISIDLSIFIYGTDLPSPWYVDTSYTIPFYVVVAGADVPNAHVKITIESLTAEFDTGPIATSDNYFHSIDFRLASAGPTTLAMSVKVPAGYADNDKSNNKGSIGVDVQPKP